MTTFTYKKKSLRFDGTNYTLWKNQMECHLRCLGEEYWKITNNVCNVQQNGVVIAAKIKEVEFNIRAKEALLSALTNPKMTNVIGLQTTHEI